MANFNIKEDDKMTIGERIKYLRESKGISQIDLATAAHISKQNLYKYENNIITNIPSNKIEAIASKLEVSPAAIMGWSEYPKPAPIPSNMYPLDELTAVRVLSSVRAGYDGTIVDEYYDEFEAIPTEMLHGYPSDECFLFSVVGESMYPRILNGDKIVVHRQSSVDSGDTAIIIYNGDEATVKKVSYIPGEDWVELIPANPEYQTKRIEGEDLQYCRVFGKVIGLMRSF